MSEAMTKEAAKELRKPFPPESIGKLPKGGVMLDYVGHAAVTDRLLTIDPEWTWEPMALTPEGLPALDRHGNLWIRLTVCGVTRLGVGDGRSMKELIGDAIRNAAMRFGVALDLWAKEDLVEFARAAQAQQPPPPPDPVAQRKRQVAELWTAKHGVVAFDPTAAAAEFDAEVGGDLRRADADQLDLFIAYLTPTEEQP